MAGSPDTIVEELKANEAAGIQQVHTRFTIGTLNPPIWNRSFALFVNDVMPRIDARTFDPPIDTEIQNAVRQGPPR